MAIAWDEDRVEDQELIEANVAGVLREIVRQAALRHRPTVAMAQAWHRAIYKGVFLPVPYFAGEIRDSDERFPELFGYEVRVGPTPGVRSSQVPAELSRFEGAVQSAVAGLDTAIPAGAQPSNESQLRSLLTLCALAHGEWVRIHPFANGNGRTARLWANWCALRYGVRAFVRLKPRPDGIEYASAAALSMRGEHQPMVDVFKGMLMKMLTDRTRS